MKRLLLCIKLTIKPPNLIISLETIPKSPAPTKRTQFEKDSNHLFLITIETYFDLSLNISESNMASYHKYIQLIYKTIKSINRNVMIIKYKGEKEEITEHIENGVVVKVKYTLLNYTEAILSFL